MVRARGRLFISCVWALGLVGLSSECFAIPLIMLPAGEITHFTYAGQERFIDTNENDLIDAGDIFEGVVSINRILGATSGIDFSSQLADKEITSHFRFSVTGNSTDFSHLEFGLLPGDSFDLYVGHGSSKNFDPSAPDAYDRASDGQLWLGIQPGKFFESVNDRQSDGTTIGRAWLDITVNNTGYLFAPALLRTLLEKDAQHSIGAHTHHDHSVQAIFDDRVAGFSPYPQFTFSIFGEFNVFPVSEPATWLLILIGMGAAVSVSTARPRLSHR